ncbi:MAG: hypothetical protein ACP5SH_20380 [Syntrophobacteraceae bacterium]
MKDDSPQVVIIEQLSREYDEKYRNLEKLISDTDPEDVPPQLMALAERAAEHFRSAQAAILSLPEITRSDSGALPAMSVLFRTFDEMRILFHFLYESYRQRR